MLVIIFNQKTFYYFSILRSKVFEWNNSPQPKLGLICRFCCEMAYIVIFAGFHIGYPCHPNITTKRNTVYKKKKHLNRFLLWCMSLCLPVSFVRWCFKTLSWVGPQRNSGWKRENIHVNFNYSPMWFDIWCKCSSNPRVTEKAQSWVILTAWLLGSSSYAYVSS